MLYCNVLKMGHQMLDNKDVKILNCQSEVTIFFEIFARLEKGV